MSYLSSFENFIEFITIIPFFIVKILVGNVLLE